MTSFDFAVGRRCVNSIVTNEEVAKSFNYVRCYDEHRNEIWEILSLEQNRLNGTRNRYYSIADVVNDVFIGCRYEIYSHVCFVYMYVTAAAIIREKIELTYLDRLQIIDKGLENEGATKVAKGDL